MLSNLPWDVSGGVLLVREAGGVVVDLDGTQDTPASRCTLACARGLLQPLLDLIADVPEVFEWSDRVDLIVGLARGQLRDNGAEPHG
jgi:hypothetical protein